MTVEDPELCPPALRRHFLAAGLVKRTHQLIDQPVIFFQKIPAAVLFVLLLQGVGQQGNALFVTLTDVVDKAPFEAHPHAPVHGD
ncbi:hypothetical protein D3C80_2045170 [compost metagenome]